MIPNDLGAGSVEILAWLPCLCVPDDRFATAQEPQASVGFSIVKKGCKAKHLANSGIPVPYLYQRQ